VWSSLLTLILRILGVFIDMGIGWEGNAIGAKFWYNPGAFNNGVIGFCSAMVIAAFAYSGTELVGLAAAESRNPRGDFPKAVNKVFWRILIVSTSPYKTYSI
jgi:amino acid transporter